jgi:3-oxoacyl-[acyl-carrier-protein] synthase II
VTGNQPGQPTRDIDVVSHRSPVTGHRSRFSPVAVTGIGVVSPIGVGHDAFWSALSDGRSGIVALEELANPSGPRLAAAVGEFPAKGVIRSPQLRRMDRLSRMAVVASRLAVDDARVDLDALPSERAGVVFGTALGDVEDSVAYVHRVFARGPAAASPMLFPNLVLNAPAGYVAMELGFTGVNFSVAQAEVSGEHAVALGCDLVRAGRADLVLAGGGDQITPLVVEVYRRARALAGQCGGREWASPYDSRRSGIVLGEGAAMLVLESFAQARARGATIYATIDGARSFAVAAPRYDWPARADAARAPVRALLDSDGVDLICGGANSSRRLDRCELTLFAQLLGPRAAGMSLTSIKGAIGEFGAAGALTVAAACLALRAQSVPPLCNLQEPEPDTPFHFPTGRAVSRRIDRALVCGLARGGAGVALRLSGGPAVRASRA